MVGRGTKDRDNAYCLTIFPLSAMTPSEAGALAFMLVHTMRIDASRSRRLVQIHADGVRVTRFSAAKLAGDLHFEMGGSDLNRADPLRYLAFSGAIDRAAQASNCASPCKGAYSASCSSMRPHTGLIATNTPR